MKKTFFSVVIIYLIPVLLLGQMKKEGQISLHVDVARFKAQENWNYLEMYFSIPREQLEYRKANDKYEAHFKLGAELYLGDSLFTAVSRKNVDTIDSLGSIKGQHLNDQFSVFLNEGTYHLKAGIEDLTNNGTGSLEMDVPIKSFSSDRLEISDIQLGLRIVPDTAKSQFVKNGYRILPNPHGIYGIDWPILYYYCEVYNLSPIINGKDSKYTVNIQLADKNKNVIRALPPKIRETKGASVVEVGSIVVLNLVSDTYEICVDIIDGARADTTSTAKSFFVYRQSDFVRQEQPTIEDRMRTIDETYGMTEAELDILFDKYQYIADKEERKVYNKLDLEGKRKFMATFWNKRDPDLSTEVNEVKQEYLRRLTHVDSEFSFGTKKGWRTDRGRVYLVYGEPDQIDRYPSSISQKPFQVWYYHSIEGGIEFVFIDRSGFGEMVLVHSTSRNEIQDYEWQEKWLK